MAVSSIIFPLFSFLICGCSTANKRETLASSEEGFSEDQEEGDTGFVKRDLIIAAMSVLLVIVSVILMCCCFLQYKLVTQEEKILKKEAVQTFAIQTHSLRKEICIVLSPERKVPSGVMPLEPSQSEISAIQSLLSDLTLPASSDSLGFGYKNRSWSNSSADPTDRIQTLETCMSTLSKSKTHLQQPEDYCVCSRSSSPASESTEGCTCEDRETSCHSAGTIFCPIDITKDITSSSNFFYPCANE